VRALDLAERFGVNLQGAVTWAFEYDGYPYFDGSRVLTTRGIDKPVINFPRMLGKMSGQRLDATSSGQVPLDEALTSSIQGAPDVGVLSSLDGGRLSVFVWHYHDDQLPKPDADINVSVEGLPWSGRGKLTRYRIDDNHSNSYALWLKYGSPQNVTTEQYAALKAAGQLATLGEPQDVQVANTGAANMTFSLPIHSLTLLVLEQDV
jgi:xylan 1,4-beta-xylosidase